MKRLHASFIALSTLISANAWGAPDEIQVYTDEMNDPGQYGVELHMNYVPKGDKSKWREGAMASNHRFQMTPEFSYGITKYLEAGLYVPTAISSDGNFHATGLRPRLKYIHPKADGSIFFWGVNTEFGYSSLEVSDTMWGMEIRPIMGVRTDKWLVSFNPIIDIPLSKGGMHAAAFEPSLKVMRKINEDLELGIEHYSGLGAMNNLQGLRNQEHTTYMATDFKVRGMEVNFGVGHGYQKAEDDWVIKSIVAFPFN
ncbi:MAG: hypothetical protein EBR14_03465 [Methylophilaceae bacterium]|nr:hypothetical protein [Methylophilaceae bacterium]